MRALVADPSSRYHALAGVFAWEAPVLSLATAGGEANWPGSAATSS